jgi:hypothetical protein
MNKEPHDAGDIVDRLRDINRNPPDLRERRLIADEIERLRAVIADEQGRFAAYRVQLGVHCDSLRGVSKGD